MLFLKMSGVEPTFSSHLLDEKKPVKEILFTLRVFIRNLMREVAKEKYWSCVAVSSLIISQHSATCSIFISSPTICAKMQN